MLAEGTDASMVADKRGTTDYDFEDDWDTKETDMLDVAQFLRSVLDTDQQYHWTLFKDCCKLLAFNRFEEFTILTGAG